MEIEVGKKRNSRIQYKGKARVKGLRRVFHMERLGEITTNSQKTVTNLPERTQGGGRRKAAESLTACG